MLGVLLLTVACTPSLQTAPKQTPLAKASPSPIESPTPSPSPPPLQITSAVFHAGEVGFGYAATHATAAGGVPPYTWSIVGGAMPPGIAMDSTGIVSGTPGALGTFLFTVQVSDAAAATATIDTSINVVRLLAVSPTCPTNFPCMVEAGCTTVCGGFGNQAGGTPPYSYRVVAGAIPTGMALSAFSLTRSFPAPPPGGTTDWVFTVRVIDGLGATAQTTAKFHVFPHIALTSALSPASCSFATGAQCVFKVNYTSSMPGLPIPPVNASFSNPLPNAPILKATTMSSSGTATVSIPPPTCSAANKGVPFTWTLTVVISDGSPCGPSAGQYCATSPVTAKLTLTC